jgi:uncharacterized protein YjiS (DUF1127 family)
MQTYDLVLPPQSYSTWRPARPVASNPFAAVLRLSARWIERTRQRQALAGLDDHMLRDIGITRVEAVREAEKPFWR